MNNYLFDGLMRDAYTFVSLHVSDFFYTCQSNRTTEQTPKVMNVISFITPSLFEILHVLKELIFYFYFYSYLS